MEPKNAAAAKSAYIVLENGTLDGQRKVYLAADYDALVADNLALARGLKGKHAMTGATYERLIARIAELEKEQIAQSERIKLALRVADPEAAVAVVMPERKDTVDWQGGYDAWGQGYNDALDGVARLNRVKVPLELLERVCKNYSGKESWDALEPDRLVAAKELRAILEGGKS